MSPGCGRLPGTSRVSPTRWWTASSASSASARTTRASRARRASRTGSARLGTRGSLTAPRLFNLMFKTFMGPVEEDAAVVYLRPETAQGIYVNYLNVLQGSRQKVPFASRRSGRRSATRSRPGTSSSARASSSRWRCSSSVRPGEDERWFEYWREQRMAWQTALVRDAAKLRWHQHGPGELAHYAKAAYDIEFEFPFGCRSSRDSQPHDFDLSRHQQASGKKLEYFDQSGTSAICRT